MEQEKIKKVIGWTIITIALFFIIFSVIFKSDIIPVFFLGLILFFLGLFFRNKSAAEHEEPKKPIGWIIFLIGLMLIINSFFLTKTDIDSGGPILAIPVFFFGLTLFIPSLFFIKGKNHPWTVLFLSVLIFFVLLFGIINFLLPRII